ncbi:MAG TPA: lipopolysaccharide biosynthesis protein [Dictyobacter sp.]|nr:lipopolysaccharide biosynthesis protein [Dictyobacter sp.]
MFSEPGMEPEHQQKYVSVMKRAVSLPALIKNPTDFQVSDKQEKPYRVLLKGRLKPENLDIAQRRTQPLTMVISHAAMPAALMTSSYMIDNVAVDQQLTWMVPVYTKDIPHIYKKRKQNAGDEYQKVFLTLIKNSGIYAITSAISPLLSLFLSPFLTRSFSHEDYGVFIILNTMIALLTGMTQLGLGLALFRVYNYDYENDSQKRLIALSTMVHLLLLSSLIATIGFFCMAPYIAQFFLRDVHYSNLVRIAAFVIFVQNMTVSAFSWLRAEGRAVPFGLLSVGNACVNLLMTVWLVGGMHWGINGALLAMGSGYTLIVLGTLPKMLSKVGIRFHLDVAKNLLSFGLSTVPGLLSLWVLQLSDRYFLSVFGSFGQAASYAVAYALGNMVGPLIIAPFSMAWYAIIYPIAKKREAKSIYTLIFRYYCIVLLIVVFGVAKVAQIVLVRLYPPAYVVAVAIIPIIALSNLFYGMFEIFTVGISIRRKVWFNVMLMPCAAVLNIVCNFLLIPHYGSMGAAISTLIAYVVLMCVTYVVNQSIYPIPFEIDLFGIALLIGIIWYVGAEKLSVGYNAPISWFIAAGSFFVYAGVLVVAGWMMRGQKRRVNFLKKG